MTYRESLEYLSSFYDTEQSCLGTIPFYDLCRIERLVELFGNPHRRFKTIHITGTKGKGSTSAIIASVLSRAGYKTGLYTSPHLLDIRERIRVDGTMISRNDFARRVEEYRSTVDPALRPSFFEVYTCIAFNHFARKKIDFAVLEVGMGGRLDATNVVTPLVSAITPISFDHTEVLGNSLRAIAREKAGIIKPGSVCISAVQKKDALSVIRATCRENKAPLYVVGEDIVCRGARRAPATMRWIGEVFDVKGLARNYKNIRLPLAGEHQRANCALAVGVIDALVKQGYRIPRTAVMRGIRNVGARRSPRGARQSPLRARCEVIRRDPLVIVDAAHNVASMEALRKTLVRNFGVKKAVVICGFLKGKDISGMAREIERFAKTVIITRPDSARAADPAAVRKYFFVGARHAVPLRSNKPGDAYKKALGIGGPNGTIVITGSFYLVADVLRMVTSDP
ncbi:MAG: bifunctional folylpolyglutamate synthase/dihydrofolate synthase [Candidatus Omnitrophica bacterium]|nr:bifunctional folylpolyglutamate synthase/dihydrofolate synthase [Candidatus Omnitrophota bacterium]